MEINIVSEEKNKIEFEVIGEDHTLCNALRKKLWEDRDLEVAAYRIEHPQISDPKMIVEMKKGSPKKALSNAVDGLKEDIKSLKTSFKNAK